MTSPDQAIVNGIGMVHQEFMLIPGFSVGENIKLNREPLSPTLISRILGKAWIWWILNGSAANHRQRWIGWELPCMRIL